MFEYGTVLIAIDLQGGAEQVLTRAREVIDKSCRSVHILSAAPDPAYFYTTYPTFSDSLPAVDWDELLQERAAQLDSLAKKAGFSEAETIAEYGKASNVILAQAQRLEADLIIVGSHGKYGVRLLLGSTANNVLHRATCDVLAVRITKDKPSHS